MNNYDKIIKSEWRIILHHSFNFLGLIVLLTFLSIKDIENTILYSSLRSGIFILYGILSGALFKESVNIFWKKSFFIVLLSTILSILLSGFIFLDKDFILVNGYWGGILINMNDFTMFCFFVISVPFLVGYGIGAIYSFIKYLVKKI